MKRTSAGTIITVVLIIAAFAIGSNLSRWLPSTATPDVNTANTTNNGAPPTNTKRAVAVGLAASGSPTTTLATVVATVAATARATSANGLPTATLIPSITPSLTLRPAPTLEPPTATIAASDTLIPSLTPTVLLTVDIPGLQSGATSTSVAGEGCQKRKDWKLTYTVQRGDALARIADLYNTSVKELIKGNCLTTDGNVIIAGQVLLVPGTSQPVVPAVKCVPYEVLTPFNGTTNVAGGGNLTFDWHGPLSPKTLIRVIRPDNTLYEDVVELRQNESVDALHNFNAAGTYRWYLFPLDENYVQDCPEGGPYYFTKDVAPTFTPTSKPIP